jgi:hypothetical protein
MQNPVLEITETIPYPFIAGHSIAERSFAPRAHLHLRSVLGQKGHFESGDFPSTPDKQTTSELSRASIQAISGSGQGLRRENETAYAALRMSISGSSANTIAC